MVMLSLVKLYGTDIPCAKPWNLPITSAELLSFSMVLVELSLAERRSIAVTLLDFKELKNKRQSAMENLVSRSNTCVKW